MLIRGREDWGICIGKWEGFVKGVPGVAGVNGTEETPGIKGTPGTKGQPGSLSIKFFSLFETQEWKQVEKRGDHFSIGLLGKKLKLDVDLKTGVISFPPEVKDVPRQLHLGFQLPFFIFFVSLTTRQKRTIIWHHLPVQLHRWTNHVECTMKT